MTVVSLNNVTKTFTRGNVTALQNIAAGTTVKFRIFAWGATDAAATYGFRMIGPKITGTVSAIGSGLGASAVPEPASAAFAALSAAVWLATRTSPASGRRMQPSERTGGKAAGRSVTRTSNTSPAATR